MAFADNTKALGTYNELNQRLGQEKEVNVELANQIVTDEAMLNNYLVPVKSYDNYLLTKLDQINSKKQQVADLFASLITFSGSDGTSSCTYSNTAESSSSAVSVSGTEATFGYNCVTAGIPPVKTCISGKRSEIRKDVLAAYQYPDVETYNIANANTYYNNTSYTAITSSNLGLGQIVYFYYDGSDAQGLSAASSLLGYYYPITNVSGTCYTTKQSIDTLISQIGTLRTEITSFLAANSGGGFSGPNNLRREKHQKKLNVYSSKISKDISDTTILRLQSAIDSTIVNESTIQSYESTL